MTKKISAYLSILAVLSFMTVSCDKIEGPYSETIKIDTTRHDSAIKRVLLEDYTGHTCVNCPDAAIIASDLKELYGDKLIVMAVHAGWFSNPTPTGDFADDFRTPEGTEWDTYFGISAVGNPNGMVNRKGFGSSEHILSPSAWAGAISAAVNEPLTVDLKIENVYTSSTRSLNTEVTVNFIEEVDKNLKLIVCITEDGIVAPQKNNNAETGPVPIIYDYVHNHMLRAVINGASGTEVATLGTPNSESVKKSFTNTLNSKLTPENCSVVAFVYDNDTKEVLQVSEKEL